MTLGISLMLHLVDDLIHGERTPYTYQPLGDKGSIGVDFSQPFHHTMSLQALQPKWATAAITNRHCRSTNHHKNI